MGYRGAQRYNYLFILLILEWGATIQLFVYFIDT